MVAGLPVAAERVTLTSRVLAVVAESRTPLQAPQVAEVLGEHPKDVRKRLHRLAARAAVVAVARGGRVWWAPPDHTTEPPPGVQELLEQELRWWTVRELADATQLTQDAVRAKLRSLKDLDLVETTTRRRRARGRGCNSVKLWGWRE